MVVIAYSVGPKVTLSLSPGDVTFLGVTTLKQPDGTPYPTGSLDPEGFT